MARSWLTDAIRLTFVPSVAPRATTPLPSLSFNWSASSAERLVVETVDPGREHLHAVALARVASRSPLCDSGLVALQLLDPALELTALGEEALEALDRLPPPTL